MKTGYLLGPVMSKIIDSLQQKFLFCYLFQLGILNFVTKIQKLENAPRPPPSSYNWALNDTYVENEN